MTTKIKPQLITRLAPLLDLELGADTTDGRELVAYAAVFDKPVEVVDRQGHYMESINRAAFNRTMSHHPKGQGLQALVNHGKDIYGMPSDRFALPYARITDVTIDERGLLTRSQILHTPLGDEIVELVRAGAITGFSFSGYALRSSPEPVRGQPYRATRGGDLVLVERMEWALKEFGPAVFPVYDDAEVVALRAGTLDMAPYDDGTRTLVLSEAQRTATLEEAPLTAPVIEADPEDGSNVETPSLAPSAQLRIRLNQATILGATNEQTTPRDRP